MNFQQIESLDLFQAMDLVGKCFGEAYAKRYYDECKAKDGFGFYLVKIDNKVVATGAFDFSPCNDNIVEAYFVCVSPTEQHKGIGKFLMSEMIRENVTGTDIKTILCTCNIKLVHMYKNMGFEVLMDLDENEVLMGCKTNR